MTSFSSPLPVPEAVQALLDAGWSCFRHGTGWWITRRVYRDRLMIPVPHWQVDYLCRNGMARITGLVLTPTFHLSHRRAA